MKSKTKLGFIGCWSMAVGGMVGGGIFSTLGVVVMAYQGFQLLTYDYEDIAAR